MKLFFRSVFVLMTLITSVQAQGTQFGVKVGANFASVNGNDASDLDGRTSFHAGGVARIGVSKLFSVQPEIVYSSQGYTGTQGQLKITGKLDYINIPVLADFTVAKGLSLQGGPQLGISITDEVEIGGQTIPIGSESMDFSAVVGAQYRFSIGLFIQARYAAGLTNVIGKETIEGVSVTTDAKNSVFSLSAGMLFN
jgi:hypothetical protein